MDGGRCATALKPVSRRTMRRRKKDEEKAKAKSKKREKESSTIRAVVSWVLLLCSCDTNVWALNNMLRCSFTVMCCVVRTSSGWWALWRTRTGRERAVAFAQRACLRCAFARVFNALVAVMCRVGCGVVFLFCGTALTSACKCAFLPFLVCSSAEHPSVLLREGVLCSP